MTAPAVSTATAALAQRRLEESVERALLGRWVDNDDGLLTELIEAVFGPAADLSQRLAVEHYMADRAANRVPGRYLAEPPGIPEPQIPGIVIWARGTAVADVSFRKLVLGAVQHKLADAGREAIIRNVNADPRARGWQRMVHSDCVFCRMVASNGAVFTKDTARFAAHDNCRCTAVCAWNGREAKVQKWDEARSQRSRIDAMPEGTEKEREKKARAKARLMREQNEVRVWIERNPDAVA